MKITPDSPPITPTATAIRAAAFAQLVVDVQACRRCPRMEGGARVLGPGNGDPSARVLVIAETPGRLGADRSGVPLQGDQTGRQFAIMLAHAGLARRDLFITNAVLRNPRDSQGRNAPPVNDELDRCADHLRATLALLDPAVVVTLGAVALRALRRVAPHDLVLASAVGAAVPWSGRVLVSLYHPGPRARLHRPVDRQLEDFAQLDLGDVQRVPQGLVITVRRSKTDQEGEGMTKAIPYGRNEETCPVRALDAWLAVAKLTNKCEPILRPVDWHGNVKGTRLDDQSVALIVKHYAEKAGLDPNLFAGHSLRAGLPTSAAAAGVEERDIMAQTGHRSTQMVRRYIRDGECFQNNAAGRVGL